MCRRYNQVRCGQADKPNPSNFWPENAPNSQQLGKRNEENKLILCRAAKRMVKMV